MKTTRVHALTCRSLLAIAAALLLSGAGTAQTTTNLTDSQVEGNVLKALSGAPQLAGENIVPNTVYGTVTLSGTVKDETTRQMAETLAARAPGVMKVVDELTLAPASSDASEGTNPLLQSDGTMAPAPAQGQTQRAPDPDVYAAQHGITADAQAAPDPGSATSQPAYRQPYPEQPSGPPQGQPPYGPPNAQDRQVYPPRRRAQDPQRRYAGGPDAPPPYGAQVGGQPVTVGQGSLLRIRINEGLDSKHTQPGATFDGVVLNDVVAGGAVAIPRGAGVEGVVADAKSGGVISGHGELSLKLTQVTLGGKTFPLTTDVWKRDSSDKGLQTVNNAVGLGAAGAIIGAIAGGGAGAAIGAGVGGAAGVGSSAASGGRQVLVPSEAILTFHLAQPAPVTTVSQAEMDRLSSGVPVGAQQPRMARRYPAPVYYGPVYYPRPYYPYPY